MNYHIIMCGRVTKVFDIILKLLIETAREADYLVSTVTRPVLSPYSTLVLEMKLIGSSRQDITQMVLDFDNLYCGDKLQVQLSPKILEIPVSDDQKHYWGVAGSLFKVVTDLSPAYITSHLLDKNMNSELAVFKQYTLVSLPLSLQAVIAGK